MYKTDQTRQTQIRMSLIRVWITKSSEEGAQLCWSDIGWAM